MKSPQFAFCFSLFLLAVLSLVSAQATRPYDTGEKIPSEDSLISDFHSLGLIHGQTNIYRCGCPVRDLARKMTSTQPSESDLAGAKVRMDRLRELGIRTIISFEVAKGDKEDPTGGKGVNPDIVLERAAAGQSGIKFVSFPMSNSGKNSLQDIPDAAVLQWIEPVTKEIFNDAKTGGVVFHCAAGHDRTGIVAGYLRVKYQHWPVTQAIEEMRRLGHNWPKYSTDNGLTSWHENHLRAIVAMQPN